MKLRAAATAVAATVLCALAGASAAQAANKTSSNWAGYAASRKGVKFKHVAGSWVQPAADCSDGRRTYSAVWVGIGGYHTNARALEQLGTEADCSAGGKASYSAWYELVPEASIDVDMRIRPGDRMTAGVTVTGHTVTLKMHNLTTGARFAITRTASAIDVTSAEWIVEAPSLCTSTTCETMPLASFGTTTFTRASARTTTGHSGAIADPRWNAVPIDLVTAVSTPRYGTPDGGVELLLGGSAVTGGLSTSGRGFTVTYRGTGQTAQTVS